MKVFYSQSKNNFKASPIVLITNYILEQHA